MTSYNPQSTGPFTVWVKETGSKAFKVSLSFQTTSSGKLSAGVPQAHKGSEHKK